jgi:hypothetical protein
LILHTHRSSESFIINTDLYGGTYLYDHICYNTTVIPVSTGYTTAYFDGLLDTGFLRYFIDNRDDIYLVKDIYELSVNFDKQTNTTIPKLSARVSSLEQQFNSLDENLMSILGSDE